MNRAFPLPAPGSLHRLTVALAFLTFLSAAFAELAGLTGFSDPALLASLRSGTREWWRPGETGHLVALSCLLLAMAAGLGVALGSRAGAALYAGCAAAVAPFVPAFAPWQEHLDRIAVGVLALLVAGRALLKPEREGLIPWWHRAGRAARIGALGAALLLLVAFGIEFLELDHVRNGTTDFVTYYEAAVAVSIGADPYAGTFGDYLYPPTFAWLFRPLTSLTRTGASLLWFQVKLILAAVSLVLCFRGLEGERLAGRARAAFAVGVALVALRFCMIDLQFGNTNVIVLFLVLAALHADTARRPAAAGFLLALAVSIKVVPAIFAGYFLARRKFRTLLWLGLFLVAVNGAPWFSQGPRFHSHWSAYAEHGMGTRLASGEAQLDNQSLQGALSRSLPLDPTAIRLVWLVLSTSAAVATIATSARLRVERPPQQFTAAGAFFLLMLLVSPGSWVVHYTAVLLPMAAVLRHLLAWRWRPRGLAVLFLAANLVFTVSGLWRWSVRLADRLSLFVLVTALLLAALLATLRSARENP